MNCKNESTCCTDHIYVDDKRVHAFSSVVESMLMLKISVSDHDAQMLYLRHAQR